MSITKDFEKKKTRIGDYWVSEEAYKPDDVDALLAHARALEAMLKELEWSGLPNYWGLICPICKGTKHTRDCALAKLLEGTNQ